MLRFDADDFTAKLPWFYHGMPFDPPAEGDVFSFEVNGLDLPEAEYALTLEMRDPAPSLEISRDGVHFMPVAAEDRLVALPPVDLSTRRISLFFREDAPDAPSPVSQVYLHAPCVKPTDLPRCPAFSDYLRDIGAAESEALARWDELWPMLSDVSFGTSDLAPMRDALLDWCERRQVVDPADPHFGAIYSEEDKFDFRDAASAAAAFAQAWQRTGDEALRQRALEARSYVYRGQHGDGERAGGWAHMVSGAWGGDHQTNFTRITQPLPPVDGVDTAIVINLLCSAIRAGLEPDAEDLRRLRMGAQWMLRSELRPGVFAHHEGATHDCQNSNALAAMALSRAHNTLLAAGEDAPKEWLEAALRGFEHYLEGQEAIGVWPYRFAEIGRGQRFGEQNVPDQGMGLYHFLVAAEELGLTGRNDVQEALKRAARWYLCTSRIDPARGAGPGPTVDLQYKRDGGGLLFSSFTWCRFMAAAVLLRISRLTDEREPWRALALRLMEHVRAKLWNEDDPERAPVVSSCRPDITLQSWIAAAEWEAVLLEEMIEGLGHAT
ncbi:MAG: hypothetical protein GX131_16240 [candidate division WS1 bacterium]|nr:hypothetical protein [candidate division WS1 bacterium]